MRKAGIFSTLLAIVGYVCLAQAQLLSTGAGPKPGFSPACTASSNWITKASITVAADKIAYDTLLCGLTTDGLINTDGTPLLIDALYVYAAVDSTTALLNMIGTGTTYNSSVNGAAPPTFVAYTGYTGTASGYIDTVFNPNTASSPKFVRNSAHVMACVSASRSADQVVAVIGNGLVANTSIFPKMFGEGRWAVNMSASVTGTSSSNAQGSWIVTRTGSTTQNAYLNGSAFGGTDTTASVAVDNTNIYVFARDDGSASFISQDQISAASIGAGLTSTQAGNFRTRILNYLANYFTSGC